MKLGTIIFFILLIGGVITWIVLIPKRIKPRGKSYTEDDDFSSFKLSELDKMLEHIRWKEKQEEIKPEPKPEEPIIEVVHEPKPEPKKKDKFNLKDAVVYSTILERKKFKKN